MGEDRLREETKRLIEEKESYQIAAKETLKKLVDDKVNLNLKAPRETCPNFFSLFVSFERVSHWFPKIP